MADPIARIAILGAGKLGVTLAQLALKAGYEVYIAGSGEPAKIALSVKVLAPGAEATDARTAIAASDVVILALPLGKYRDIPADLLKDKLVIDSMNYWWEVDGEDDSLRNPASSTSELVQDHLSAARVVKALSHMGYHHLRDEAKPAGTPGRKAIAIAGNDEADTRRVAELIDRIGFDPLPIGALSTGRQLEPGFPAFGANVGHESLRQMIR